MTHRARNLLGVRRGIALVSILVAGGCAHRVRVAPLSPLPFSADTVRSQRIADGVTRHYVYAPRGPWAIHVLDVDLGRCNAVVALKGGNTPAGRMKTTDMLAARPGVVGGVNADFFSLADGTPTGLLVVDGRMLTPPSAAPVLAIDSSGVAHIARFSQGGGTLRPFYPRNAVGGRPMLIRDSVIVTGIDSAGGAGFAGARHPRTAAGVARDGRRLILAAVDGRQKPFSDGMTLRELSVLMLALGARDAVNLDGGGSTTFVYADPAAHDSLRIANRPSDKEGERTVGDALGIVHACGVR